MPAHARTPYLQTNEDNTAERKNKKFVFSFFIFPLFLAIKKPCIFSTTNGYYTKREQSNTEGIKVFFWFHLLLLQNHFEYSTYIYRYSKKAEKGLPFEIGGKNLPSVSVIGDPFSGMDSDRGVHLVSFVPES